MMRCHNVCPVSFHLAAAFQAGAGGPFFFSRENAQPVEHSASGSVLMGSESVSSQDSAADYVARVKRDLGLAEVGIALAQLV